MRLELPPLDALQKLRQEAHRYRARVIQRIHAKGRPRPSVFAGRKRSVGYVGPPLMPAALGELVPRLRDDHRLGGLAGVVQRDDPRNHFVSPFAVAYLAAVETEPSLV